MIDPITCQQRAEQQEQDVVHRARAVGGICCTTLVKQHCVHGVAMGGKRHGLGCEVQFPYLDMNPSQSSLYAVVVVRFKANVDTESDFYS
jgi:hypothetical protein